MSPQTLACHVLATTYALVPICVTDLTRNVWVGCTSLFLWEPRGKVRGVYMYVCMLYLGYCPLER